MIRKRLKGISAVMLATVISLSAAGCTSATISPNTTLAADSSTKINQKIAENVYINTSVPKLTQTSFNVYKASPKSYDENKLKSIFFKENDNIKKSIFEGPHGDKSSNTTLLDSGKSHLRLDKYSLDYSTKLYDEYSPLISGTKEFFSDDLKKSFPKTELTTLNKSAAIEMVRNTSKDLGFDIAETPTVYALDAESLNKKETEFMSDKEYNEFIDFVKENKGDVKSKSRVRNWTTDNEAYLVVFDFEKDKTPFFSGRYSTPDNSTAIVEASQVHAIINKNGIVMFKAHGAYNMSSVEKENTNIIDANKAIETVKAKYSAAKITDPIEINNISFRYVPNNVKKKDNFTVTPAWVFNITQTFNFENDGKKNSFTKKSYIVVDAVTGKEII